MSVRSSSAPQRGQRRQPWRTAMGRYRTGVPRHVPASVTELSRIGLLASLPGETLTKLAERMQREEIAPGQTIIAEGDTDRRFYALLSGMAAVAQSSLGPRRLLRPGETFGEVAVAMGIPRTATITSVTPCTVASCDQQ